MPGGGGGGGVDHQPQSKPTEHPTPVPDGEKSAQPATPIVYIKSSHDDGPTSSKPLPEFNLMTLLERPLYYTLQTMGRD